jgi:hypothetical protein
MMNVVLAPTESGNIKLQELIEQFGEPQVQNTADYFCSACEAMVQCSVTSSFSLAEKGDVLFFTINREV